MHRAKAVKQSIIIEGVFSPPPRSKRIAYQQPGDIHQPSDFVAAKEFSPSIELYRDVVPMEGRPQP
jgi:hypothetical protein